MTDDGIQGGDPEEIDLGEQLGVPRRARFPGVSIVMACVFLSASGLLLYLVRGEIAYFFASGSPEAKWTPGPERPVPVGAPSNVYAEVRIDPTSLCDYWDPAENPFPSDESYAFTLKMGFGGSYFMTCVGTGEVRPRLWILKPESESEARRIHQDAVTSRLARTTFQAAIEGPVPEVHIPGGEGCVNDLCRGRLIRFGEYASNVFAGVGSLEQTLTDRLGGEFRRTGHPALRDDDYLLILGETPGGNWWYLALAGLVALLSALNVVLVVRFLLRWRRARSQIRGYLEQARRNPAP